ncbi:MAG: hypothetical protein AAF192_00350 [Pseudomonadota bacterium]
MGLGPTAGVFAGHLVIVAAAVLLICRFVPLGRAAMAGAVPGRVLSGLAVSSMLVATVAVAEAVYYGAARILIDHGVDLWSQYPAVYLLRIAVAAALWWHMPIYWRWRGLHGRVLHLRCAAELTLFFGFWLLAFSVLR